MPQLRQNIITGDWVVIAPERAKRPNDFISATQTRTDLPNQCPFCKEAEKFASNPYHKHHETDEVFVIPNKYPAFIEDPHHSSPRSHLIEDNFYLMKPSLGGHDVIVVKDHFQDLPNFTTNIWRDMFFIFRERYRYYDKDRNALYTMAIYNEKPASGASIAHPHAQVFASNVVPNQVTKEMQVTENYYQEQGVSAFEELVNHEIKANQRIIHQNQYYVAFVQYAARFPFETWIVPRYQQSRFDRISAQQLAALVPTVVAVMKKINKVLKEPPLNFYIHSAPNSLEEVDFYRWHLEVTPRLSTYGGFELGSGLVIDVVSPELAAEFLNEGGAEKF